MASAAESIGRENNRAKLPQARPDRFLVGAGLALVVIMVVAFTPTYFVPLAHGTFRSPSVLHLHGALFFAWPVLFVIQAALASRGRIALHRSLGLVGIALASAMVIAGLMAITSTMQLAVRLDREPQGRALALVAFSGLFLFALFVTAAVAMRRRRDWHLRLMFLATLVLMQAASARFILFVLLGVPVARDIGPPPVVPLPQVGVAHLSLDVIALLGVCLYDWLKRRNVHTAYLVGGSLILVVHAFRHLLVDSDAWRWAAGVFVALGT